MAIEQYQHRRKKVELAFGATDTSKTAGLYLDGRLFNLHVRVPDFTNAVTAKVSVLDADDYAYYESGDLAKGQNHNIDKELALAGEGAKVKVTLSGAPGGEGGTVVVALYYWGRE